MMQRPEAFLSRRVEKEEKKMITALVLSIIGSVVGMLIKLFKEGFDEEAASEAEERSAAAEAVVVSKRTHVIGGENARTSYYITFEFTDDSRREFCVDGRVYGSVAEGDRGSLRFYGTRFVSFNRSSDRFDAEDPDKAVHTCPGCGATYIGRVCDYCDTPWHG